MAMGLGQFIAAALGMAAAGAMGEVGRQKREEKHQADQLTRQLMLQHIQQYALTPGEETEPVEEMLKNAGMSGSQVKGLAGLIRGTKQAATQAAVEQIAKSRGILEYAGLPPELAGPGGGYPGAKKGIPMPSTGGQGGLPSTGAPMPQLQPGPTTGANVPSAMLAARMGSQGALAPPPVQPLPQMPQPRLVGAGTTQGTTQGPSNVVTPLPVTGGPVPAPLPAGADGGPGAQVAQVAPVQAAPVTTGNPEFDAMAQLMGPNFRPIRQGTIESLDVPGVGKIKIDARGAMGKDILARGSAAGISPRTVSQFANANGASMNPEAFKQYQTDDFNQWFGEYATAKAKGRPWMLKNPDFLKEAAWNYMQERGGTVDNLKEILPGPEAMNNFALTWFASQTQNLLKPGGFAAALREARQQGITMDPKTEERIAQETQGLLRQAATAMDPRYATNENALQKKVNEWMGFAGVTPEQFKTAAAPATKEDLDAAAIGRQIPTKAQLGRGPQLQPLTSAQARTEAATVQDPAMKQRLLGAAAGGPPVEKAVDAEQDTAQALQEAQEARQAREREAGARGSGLGTARAGEEAKAFQMVTPQEREKLVDAKTGERIAVMTKAQRDAGINAGTIGELLVTPATYADLRRIQQDANTFLPQLVDRPNGIFSLGPIQRKKLALIIKPLNIGWTHFGVTLPVGLLEKIPLMDRGQFTPQQVEDAIQLEAFRDFTGIAFARMHGDRGNIPAKMLQGAKDAIPGFPDDDYANAKAKSKQMQHVAETMSKGWVSVRGVAPPD